MRQSLVGRIAVHAWDVTATMKVNELEVARPVPETVIQYRLGRVVGVV